MIAVPFFNLGVANTTDSDLSVNPPLDANRELRPARISHEGDAISAPVWSALDIDVCLTRR